MVTEATWKPSSRGVALSASSRRAGIGVTEVLSTKMRGVENTVDQAIDLTLGLGTTSGIQP
jgi:hypothetical protein